MSPHRRTRRGTLGALVVTALVAVAGCGSSDDDTATPAAVTAATATERTFVGQVEGTEAYVAVVTDGEQVFAYLCDSQKLWNYLGGRQDGDVVRAADDDEAVLLDATLTGGEVAGTITLAADGSTHGFTAAAATGDAGFFTLEEHAADTVGQGGWIRLADGSVRGKQVTVAATGENGTVEPDAGDGGAGGSGVVVPPAAEPASVLGLAACGIAGARAAMAMNRYNRSPTAENQAAAEAAIKTMNARCGKGAAS